MNRWTMVAIIFALAALTLICAWLANPPQPQKISWCPPGQRAEYVDSGRDVTGTITVLYGCNKVAPSRAKAVAKK